MITQLDLINAGYDLSETDKQTISDCFEYADLLILQGDDKSTAIIISCDVHGIEFEGSNEPSALDEHLADMGRENYLYNHS